MRGGNFLQNRGGSDLHFRGMVQVMLPGRAGGDAAKVSREVRPQREVARIGLQCRLTDSRGALIILQSCA